MPKISRQVGSTSQVVEIVAQSTASSPPGLPLSGLLYNTASLTCYYKRNTASADVAVSLEPIATLGTFTSGGFAAVDATGMTGAYEFHLPNAALAGGADNVLFCLQGAANLAPIFLEVELTQTNNQASDNGLGAASLPTSPAANTYGEALYFADIMGGRENTAQGGTSTSITLDSGASSDTGAYIGDDIYLYGGTGGGVRGTGQRRTIVSYNTSTKVAGINRAWDTTPDSTTKFMTLPQAQANVGMWLSTAVPSPTTPGIPTAALNAAGLDAVTVETGFNAAQAIALILDMVCAQLSGLPGGPAVIRDVNNTVNRVTITFDANNNRTLTTLNPPSV
jgi:hypothetical protein